jgi:hypothetical protein
MLPYPQLFLEMEMNAKKGASTRGDSARKGKRKSRRSPDETGSSPGTRARPRPPKR